MRESGERQGDSRLSLVCHPAFLRKANIACPTPHGDAAPLKCLEDGARILAESGQTDALQISFESSHKMKERFTDRSEPFRFLFWQWFTDTTRKLSPRRPRLPSCPLRTREYDHLACNSRSHRR